MALNSVPSRRTNLCSGSLQYRPFILLSFLFIPAWRHNKNPATVQPIQSPSPPATPGSEKTVIDGRNILRTVHRSMQPKPFLSSLVRRLRYLSPTPVCLPPPIAFRAGAEVGQNGGDVSKLSAQTHLCPFPCPRKRTERRGFYLFMRERTISSVTNVTVFLGVLIAQFLVL